MKAFFFCLMVLVFSANLSAQTNGFHSFGQNDNIAYCVTGNGTPNNIVRLDNNWELLLALREPKSAQSLDSLGIVFTYSQLQLLADWKLIRRNKKQYRTDMVILDSIQTLKLRKYSQILSEGLAKKIGGEVADFVSRLERDGRARNAYSILFSYVMDGLVWRFLEEKNIIKKKELTMENPFWDGEFWTLYPKRDFYCGTNALSCRGYTIHINWSPYAIRYMRLFLSRLDLLELFLKDLSEIGKIKDTALFTELYKYNLFDKSGRITVPIIEENEKKSLYAPSEKIAKIIVDFLEATVDVEMLKKEFGFSGPSQAMIILYHEMLWDSLAELENKELIAKPKLFANPDQIASGDVSDLIFITK